MKCLAIILVISLLYTSNAYAGRGEVLHVKAERFTAPVSFRRDGFTFRRYLSSRDGKRQAILTCYSLGDKAREQFARKTGSDPVADLSCYLKDIDKVNEYTILSLPGEGLQFSPAFFWLSDINKCGNSGYRVRASVRGFAIDIQFSNVNAKRKTATMNVSTSPDASATNVRLQNGSYLASCT